MSMNRIYLLIAFSCLIIFNLSAQPAPKHEVRAAWITAVYGLDWPRTKATTPAGIRKQKEELVEILDKLKAANFNTILFQTRTRGDVLYRSDIEPYNSILTGESGKDPGYDPLAFAVEECHKRGMELHAWVVAFPAGSVAAMRRLGRKGLPQRRPELCRRCGDQWLMDPGVPATAEYLAALCGEIVRRYDVDGLHLDYIRYPEREIPFNDRTTYRRYSGRKSLAEWRRANVTRCVQAIHDTVKALKPWVKLSCSPVGKHADLARYSSRGWNARDAVFQDATGKAKDNPRFFR